MEISSVCAVPNPTFHFEIRAESASAGLESVCRGFAAIDSGGKVPHTDTIVVRYGENRRPSLANDAAA